MGPNKLDFRGAWQYNYEKSKKREFKMDLELYQLLLIAAVALFASFIQSVTGFGFGIFAMIFLPHLLSFGEANALSTMLSTLTSLSVMIVMLRKISWKNIIFPMIGCLITTVLSVYFIKSQENKFLTFLLGIALFALSIYFFFFSKKIKIKPTWYAGLIAGTLSGIMGGMFSMSGPPVVIYFMQSEDSSEKYLATVSAYFVLSNIFSIVAKASAGFITVNVWVAFLIGFVGMAAGALFGKLARNKMKPEMIKKAVYAVMAASGAVNIIMFFI